MFWQVKTFFRLLLLLLLSPLFMISCGVQSIPKAQNQFEASEAEIVNQYKRRADLIPNLVKVVKSYAKHERQTLQAVVEARSKATSTSLNLKGAASAANLQKFQQAQGALSSALSRLMVVVERYPDLKADRNFRELQAQLEGTENRITIARQRHIEAIKQFNNLVTVPPTSWTNALFYKRPKKEQWTTENAQEISRPPEVDL